MHLVLTPQTLPDEVSYNVIADLRGREHPEQIVVASGHLDSWDLGTGAIDDAAGIAVAMQTANLCKQLGLQPSRTLRVFAWMNEENGSRGSTAYMADYKDSLSNHVAAIESDLGANHPLGFRGILGSGRAPCAETDCRRARAHRSESRLKLPASPEPISTRWRMSAFRFSRRKKKGFIFNYHHSPADTLDKIDPRELAENAAVMAVLSLCGDMPQPLASHAATLK